MVMRMTFTAGLRTAGGETANARGNVRRTKHSSIGTARVREAPGARHEVNNLLCDRDSVLIIDLARYPQNSHGYRRGGCALRVSSSASALSPLADKARASAAWIPGS